MDSDVTEDFNRLIHHGKANCSNPETCVSERKRRIKDKTLRRKIKQKSVFPGTVSLLIVYIVAEVVSEGVTQAVAISGDGKETARANDMLTKNDRIDRDRMVKSITTPVKTGGSSGVAGSDVLVVNITKEETNEDVGKNSTHNGHLVESISLMPEASLRVTAGVTEESEHKSLKKIKFIRDIKIQDTSDLHIDDHTNDDDNADGTQYEENIKNVPRSDYIKKVVVLQKPFHFHIPILTQKAISKTSDHYSRPKERSQGTASFDYSNKISSINKYGHRTRDTPAVTVSKVLLKRENGEISQPVVYDNIREGVKPAGVLTKRGLEAQNYPVSKQGSEVNITSSTSSAHVGQDRVGQDYLDHLLRQHPQLVPSVNRKRSSGKRQKINWSPDEDIHHLIGKLPPDDDDSVIMGQSDNLGIIGKRNVKKMRFSQDLVDSILGHQDDLVNYRRRIVTRSNALGISPKEVFESVVYGLTPTNKDVAGMSTPSDIYQRRLEFHELFLDDSTEVEKYHFNEVINEDQRIDTDSNSKPYNAYMKILRRNKRGLKNWLKKLFRKGEAKPTSTTKRPIAKKIVITPDHTERKKGKKKGTPKKDYVVFKEVVNVNGDSQVDFLLPKALRRSVYLRKLEQIKRMEVVEKEFEEEYEKSEEKEPTKRENASNEEDEKLKKKMMKAKYHIEKNEDELRNKKRKNNGYFAHSTRSKRDVKVGGVVLAMSKDEISLVLEMLLNLIEFQCVNVNRKILDGLLSITQTTVGMSTLSDYIPRRRRTVDELFSQMLDCSSNTENRSRWSHYQLRRHQQKARNLHKAMEATGEISLVDMPLRRSKRVKRETSFLTTAIPPPMKKSDLELVAVNASFPETEKTSNTSVKMKTASMISTNDGSDDKTTKLRKLYVLVYQIISDACFKMDVNLLHGSSMVFLNELSKLQARKEYLKEVDNFLQKFDVNLANKVLTECYEAEL